MDSLRFATGSTSDCWLLVRDKVLLSLTPDFLHERARRRVLDHETADTVDAIRRGDHAVLERVVRECLPGLLRTARAAGLSVDRAEDAVQASLLVFVQRAAEFDGRAKASSWIRGILARKIMEVRRDERRDTDRDEIDETIEGRFDEGGTWARPPAGPVDVLLRGEFQRELESCLGGLSDRHRLAFVLREIDGLETSEICNILAVSVNNLGVLLYRARNGLRECLELKGFEGSNDASVQ